MLHLRLPASTVREPLHYGAKRRLTPRVGSRLALFAVLELGSAIVPLCVIGIGHDTMIIIGFQPTTFWFHL